MFSSGNTQEQSSQLAEPLWTDPGLKNGISVRELISTFFFFFKVQAGNESWNILPKSLHARKRPPPPLMFTSHVYLYPYVLMLCLGKSQSIKGGNEISSVHNRTSCLKHTQALSQVSLWILNSQPKVDTAIMSVLHLHCEMCLHVSVGCLDSSVGGVLDS